VWRKLPSHRPARIIRRVCTLAVFLQTNHELPLVVAANRDEFFDRPALGPARLGDDPWIVGGRDCVAGGTWLGVNAHGLIAGILNRRSRLPPDPARRSRGLLCLEMLQHASVDTAAQAVCSEPADRYNPFNLLIASPNGARVVGNASGHMVATALTPGLHLLTNLELNDAECPRIAKSYALFDAVRAHLKPARLDDLLAELRRILSDHSTPLDPRGDGPPNNLCVHTERFGTRSSSLLVYLRQEGRFRMWHASGPPCTQRHEEVPLPGPRQRQPPALST
jgi:uncharacterized protein with NRDE domain